MDNFQICDSFEILSAALILSEMDFFFPLGIVCYVGAWEKSMWKEYIDSIDEVAEKYWLIDWLIDMGQWVGSKMCTYLG
jgi:hypothetical protein